MKIRVKVKSVHRPTGLPPFGDLRVNDRHIWRFDNANAAKIVAKNLRTALKETEMKETENA